MILFIDDEKRYSQIYKEELELSGYKVVYFNDVADSLDFFNKNYENILVVILDIMMPPGKKFKLEDTEYGLRTGIKLYELIREKSPEIPVIIFTNVTEENVIKKFQKEKQCFYILKENFFPSELVEEIQKIIKPVP